jgi:hypothetical protein
MLLKLIRTEHQRMLLIDREHVSTGIEESQNHKLEFARMGEDPCKSSLRRIENTKM